MRGFPHHLDMCCCGISIDEWHADVGGESATNQAEGGCGIVRGAALINWDLMSHPQHSGHLFWTILSSEATNLLEFTLPYRHM
jgi:hypothetical protein